MEKEVRAQLYLPIAWWWSIDYCLSSWLLRYGVMLGAGSGSLLLYFDNDEVSDSNTASRVVPLQDSKLEVDPHNDLGHEQCV